MKMIDPLPRPAARLIRKEKPVPGPKPPTRPPGPAGINVPGSGSSPGGMICPGADGRVQATCLPDGSAAEQTSLESPVARIMRKPSALGGKSIHVQIVDGEEKGRSFDVTGIGTYTIGRKECDIVLNDEKVSRKHASIVIIREGKYAVQDLASRNGTFVNGVRLTRRDLQHNDLIRVGSTTLRFTVFDGPMPVQD